ncbi:MAG: hypothetical protein ABIR79_10735 [Candidatus Binatia bacterium]
MRRMPALLLCLLTAVVGVTPAAATECPQAVRFEPTLGASTADTGFSGFTHAKPILGNTLPLGVTCGATTPPCGTCTITGALSDAAGNHQRCANDTSLLCTPATEIADCGVPGSCKLYGSGPQALSTTSIPACLVNTITSAISGTVDPTSGDIAATFAFAGDIFVVACPACVGDPTANDGIRGGVCDSGPRLDLACDAQGISVTPWQDLPITSLDCPPNPGSLAGSLSPGPVTFSTATQSRTLSAASPPCRETGWTGFRCFCDTCNNAAADPCGSNADCPLSGGNPGICGGRRCASGANHGTPCSTNSECPGGTCNRPGEATKANSCSDFVCEDTAPVGDGTGICAGDGELLCSNHADRSCGNDTDCDDVAGACQFVNRPCFTTSGVIGDTVSALGAATPPTLDVSAPTALAMLACLPPMKVSAINAAAGLPGLTRNHQIGRLSYGEELVVMVVAAGGSASTVGSGPTSDVEATVTSPPGGTITILTTFATGTPPAGTELIPRRVVVTAPTATPSDPLAVTITIASNVIPPTQNELTIDAYLDGVGPIPNCVSGTAAIPNDPCISARTALGGGDVSLTMLTSLGGTVLLAYEPGPPVCPPTPDTCRTAPLRQSSLTLDDRASDKNDQLSWKWTHGAATPVGDFGDPVASDDYALCLYDASGLRARYRIPFGGTCDDKPCWQTKSTGFLYKNRNATPRGLTTANLKSGTVGKAQIQVKGKGPLLPTPPLLSLTPPLQLQLRNVTNGFCWGATFSTLDRQTATQIKDKSE